MDRTPREYLWNDVTALGVFEQGNRGQVQRQKSGINIENATHAKIDQNRIIGGQIIPKQNEQKRCLRDGDIFALFELGVRVLILQTIHKMYGIFLRF